MSGEPKVTRRDIKVEPSESVSISPDMQTLVADYVKCATDTDVGLCTFIFFKKHILPKHTSEGMMVDRIVHDAFLEIKVPINTAFALAVYLYDLLKEIREKPKRGVTFFGPSIIKQENEPP